MAAGKYSFIIEQGSTVNFNIVYNDSNGNPIDLSQYESKMQIKETYNSAPLLTLSSSLNADGTGLNMSNAASGALYDLDIISGSDCPVVNRILEGKVKLSKEVTIVN
jgi:hypothetical protein